MDRDPDGTDASSIKPVSSLRSKFESLGKDQPQVTSGSRQPSITSTGPLLSARAITPDEKSRRESMATNGTSYPGGTALPNTWKRRMDPPPPRPASMISLESPQRSPLMVTVDSPRSPHKPGSVDTRPSAGNKSIQMLSSTSKSLSMPISSPGTSVGTPGSESHKDPPWKHVAASDNSGNEATTHVKSVGSRSRTPPIGRPPVVNRASKPKVPVKPATLSNNSSGLVAPEQNPELTDQSASPFSTPPRSRGGTPELTKDEATQGNTTVPGNLSDIVVVNEFRNQSNRSPIKRVRGDSDTSLVGRNRAESNASFVEPSTLPDNWLPPPTHHVTAHREQHTRMSSTPARYRPMPGRDTGVSNEVPEDRPRLPARPELQTRSRRTSPNKNRNGRRSPEKFGRLPPKRSMNELRKATADVQPAVQPRIPALKAEQGSVLDQGFDRSSQLTVAPAIPAPRRSMERRKETPPPPPPQVSGDGAQSISKEEPTWQQPVDDQHASMADYPVGTKSSRRPPKFPQRPWQIPTAYDTRIFAVCGENVCTTGYQTKVWNMKTGEQLLNLEHRENIKVTSLIFKPSAHIEDEGKRIWLGTSIGDIHEVDIPSQSIVKTKMSAHARREIIRMYRHVSELWTLDDSGELNVWKPDHKGMPSLDSQAIKWRVPRGHTFSLACGKQLWIATGKEIRLFNPGASSDADFQLLRQPLSQSHAGEITAGTTINSQPNLIYFGHSDGKVSVYNRTNYACVAVCSVSLYKISSLMGVGDYLWGGYSTGMAYVYDTATQPWTLKKDWKAHERQICNIIADPSAMWKMGRLNVVTLGTDNLLRIWDGMLTDDWLESRTQDQDIDYCSFREMTAAVLTWNAGAATPYSLQHSNEDSNFFMNYMTSQGAPDIFVFGFQELVDLEDKKLTAKSLFKSKKKDPKEQEHMSHQYREWRDHLLACIDKCMPNDQTYTMLNCASMVGLFTCVFVKSSQRHRVKQVHTAEVKRGMGGLHGNKGALILRMILDDSSVCFINCHLAAGQTQTINRNNDVAAILEATDLPAYPLGDGGAAARHSDVFASGGDGSMILDHEMCILNGDLNYRIDTMGRETVVKHVQQGNLAKLLERDQLLLSRKKNPGFRLRAFQESEINFAPTYKYNVHSDEYDTSEKRRSPAWCDRILYRGLGNVKMEEYRRWDQMRVSDHRPVSGRLRLRVKTVDASKREKVQDRGLREFETERQRIARAAQ